jgi:glyoxylase-like metal-dependent hydrolase (beta-lactamase superfamily II)
MFRNCLVAIVFASLASATAWAADEAPDLKTAVDKSLKAMGAENVKTLVISGQGWDGCVGQNFDPNSATWRKFSNKNYVRSIDFEARGWRLQRVRGEGENPGRGGCNAGPVPDTPQNQVTNLNANSPWATQMEFILLPEGFLKVAIEKNATVKIEKIKGKKYTVISFMGDKAPVTGYINDLGYVEKVETKIDNNVLGDIVWDAVYTDWKDFGGVKFPAHIVQHQGIPEFFDLNVSDVKVNVPVDLTPPPGRGGRGGPGGGRGPGRGAPAGPISEDLGGGFWLITGGYAAVVGDFKDYIVVVEGPQNDMRAEQIIAEAKRLVPNKPIRYVINTHTHFDHSGGLRAFVAEGATIVTHQANKSYYEKIFKDPHTLVPDKLSQMNPQPKLKIETMTDKKVLTDGEHTIDLYHLEGSTHVMGMIVAYLPKQKILIEADEFNVGQANAPTPASINPYHTNLLANIERLNLDVDRIIPIHLPGDNRKVTMAELYTAAGKEAKK